MLVVYSSGFDWNQALMMPSSSSFTSSSAVPSRNRAVDPATSTTSAGSANLLPPTSSNHPGRPTTPRMKRVFARKGSDAGLVGGTNAAATGSFSLLSSSSPSSIPTSIGNTLVASSSSNWSLVSASSIPSIENTYAHAHISGPSPLQAERPSLASRRPPVLHFTLPSSSTSIVPPDPASPPPPTIPPKPSRLRVLSNTAVTFANGKTANPKSGSSDDGGGGHESTITMSSSIAPAVGYINEWSDSELSYRFPRPPPAPPQTTSSDLRSNIPSAQTSTTNPNTNHVKPTQFNYTSREVNIESRDERSPRTVTHEHPNNAPSPTFSFTGAATSNNNNGRTSKVLHKRRSISLSDIKLVMRHNDNTREKERSTSPFGRGAKKFPTVGPSGIMSPGGLAPTPESSNDDVLPPRGHLKSRIAALAAASGSTSTPSSSSPPQTTFSSSTAQVSFGSSSFGRSKGQQQLQQAAPQRDRAASASSLPQAPPRHPDRLATYTPPPTRFGNGASASLSQGAAGLVAVKGLGRKGWERIWGGGAGSTSRAAVLDHARGKLSHGQWPLDPPSSNSPSSSSSSLGPRDARSMSVSAAGSIPSSVSPLGLNLPRCVRPARVPGGMLFGRSLVDATRDTKIDPRSERPWLDEKGNARGLLCPALVVRCIQHLEKWGVQEEGVFRISGRSSHVGKLRAEFDGGADYVLREASPGDLDPHSVSSVFKAYLRELPEPILTNSLSRQFDAILTGGNGSSNNTFGSSSLRTVTPRLIEDLRDLLRRLPAENFSLLRELCRLLRTTAEHHETTKMPLSNLVLVFCPTLTMNPTLLGLLVDVQEDIFAVGEDRSSLDSEREPKADIALRQPSQSDLKMLRLAQMDINAASATTSPITSLPSTSSAPLSSALISPTSKTGKKVAPRPGRPTHSHNISLPLPTLVAPVTSNNEATATAPTYRFPGDEEAPRPRTPSSIRAFGALLGSKTSPRRPRIRANTSINFPPSPTRSRSGSMSLSGGSASRFSSFFSVSAISDDEGAYGGGGRSRRLSQTLPVISLSIPGDGTGMFFSPTSSPSASHRASWSEPALPLPPAVDRATVQMQTQVQLPGRPYTPIADLFRVVSSSSSTTTTSHSAPPAADASSITSPRPSTSTARTKAATQEATARLQPPPPGSASNGQGSPRLNAPPASSTGSGHVHHASPPPTALYGTGVDTGTGDKAERSPPAPRISFRELGGQMKRASTKSSTTNDDWATSVLIAARVHPSVASASSKNGMAVREDVTSGDKKGGEDGEGVDELPLGGRVRDVRRMFERP